VVNTYPVSAHLQLDGRDDIGHPARGSEIPSRASRGDYRTRLPHGHVAVAMVAPCLLGCRVPTR
jgi:hypothetical protein